MPFVKGKSGNPGGRQKTDFTIQSIARKHCPKAIAKLVDILDDDKVAASAQVASANALLDRGYGKPPQFSTGDADQFRKAVDMTDDELATIASRGCRQAVAETPDKAKLLKLVQTQAWPWICPGSASSADYKND
jgi:hypothetical protein